MHDPWFRRVYGGQMGPANWKGWLASLALALALTGLSVSVFGIGLGRVVSWLEFIAWLSGVIALGVAYQMLVNRTSSRG